MRLVRVILRVLGGLGLVLGFLAIFKPLLFVANELQEMKSYDGPISIPGAMGGSFLALGVRCSSRSRPTFCFGIAFAETKPIDAFFIRPSLNSLLSRAEFLL